MFQTSRVYCLFLGFLTNIGKPEDFLSLGKSNLSVIKCVFLGFNSEMFRNLKALATIGPSWPDSASAPLAAGSEKVAFKQLDPVYF